VVRRVLIGRIEPRCLGEQRAGLGHQGLEALGVAEDHVVLFGAPAQTISEQRLAERLHHIGLELLGPGTGLNELTDPLARFVFGGVEPIGVEQDSGELEAGLGQARLDPQDLAQSLLGLVKPARFARAERGKKGPRQVLEGDLSVVNKNAFCQRSVSTTPRIAVHRLSVPEPVKINEPEAAPHASPTRRRASSTRLSASQPCWYSVAEAFAHISFEQ